MVDSLQSTQKTTLVSVSWVFRDWEINSIETLQFVRCFFPSSYPWGQGSFRQGVLSWTQLMTKAEEDFGRGSKGFTGEEIKIG